MGFRHFSHEHPLTLNRDHRDDEQEQLCYGCERPISNNAFYTCRQCKMFLHRSCAELPQEMKHPFHTTHPLSLLPNLPYLSVGHRCDACQQYTLGFAYHCSTCNYGLDIRCATTPQVSIHHPGHQHPLTLMKPACFSCDACGTKHKEGMSYYCSTCYFWVHLDCALLPREIKHAGHHHFLSLIYSVPSEYSRFMFCCDVCSEDIKAHHWVYWCAGCRYFAHLSCATTEPDNLWDDTSEIQPEDPGPHWIQMPVPHESLVMTHIFKQRGQLGDSGRATELKHFGHEHPLTFFDIETNNEVCEACTQPISATFYSCRDCKFSLHECCAMLPARIQHPSHRCDADPLLTLLAGSPSRFGTFGCEVCKKICNGFYYQCAHCVYVLDVICASLGHAIKHVAHPHHLILITDGVVEYGCKSCHKYFSGYPYGCRACKFYLHIECALLPSKARHKYDKHDSLSLTFPSFVEKELEECYCDDCEEDINPKTWFYNCAEHDSSAHPNCICKFGPFSNIKFGGIHDFKAHPHPLTLVPKARGKFPCGYCRIVFPKPALECGQCNFYLHLTCALIVLGKVKT